MRHKNFSQNNQFRSHNTEILRPTIHPIVEHTQKKIPFFSFHGPINFRSLSFVEKILKITFQPNSLRGAARFANFDGIWVFLFINHLSGPLREDMFT